MWRSFAALLLLATPVCAQENATAYEALRVVGTQFGRGALNHVVSITGVKGDPQPEKWKIILENPAGSGVRELQVAEGKIDSDRWSGLVDGGFCRRRNAQCFALEPGFQRRIRSCQSHSGHGPAHILRQQITHCAQMSGANRSGLLLC